MAEHERICGPWFLRMAIASAGSWLAITSMSPVWAQLSSDNTLGTSVSPDVVIRGILSNQIDGGAIRGANLFQSFREFNIGDGRGVYFSNPAGIQNIISRVTGGSRSDILGTLGVLGNANLFLLNPNGIFFGSNARLDLNGSFIGSTASRLTFADSSQFDTADSTPTLTISTPLGLQFGQNAVEIRSQSAQLSVRPNQTLALVGGNVTLNGGFLSADGGRVELGSVAPNSMVTIIPANNGLALGYENVQNFLDIQLSQKVRVEANEPQGTVTIQARRLAAQEGAVVSVTTFGAGNAGALTIRTSESVDLSGSGTALFGQVARTAQGQGGNINIETKRLVVRDEAFISTSTFSSGNGGSINIRAFDSVNLTNKGFLTSSVAQSAQGQGGNISIETGRLSLEKGASIDTSTEGQGNAGNQFIRASELIDLVGTIQTEDKTLNPLFTTTTTTTTTFTTSTGQTVTIPLSSVTTTTAQPEPLTGLFARAEKGSGGNSGNITLETSQIRVRDRARISTSIAGQGKAGDQTIRARDSVELDFGSLFSQVLEGSTGEGGKIVIQTNTLDLKRDSQISVSNLGTGRGGNLDIIARNVFLGSQIGGNSQFRTIGGKNFRFLNRGRLLASSASGDGGNINLQLQNILLVAGGSIISTEAGTALLGGNGGNITISGRFVLTNRRENNQITANAFAGQGGNVQIRATEGIIGFSPIDPSSRSKITASSKLGLSGNISVDAPFFDFSRQLTELPDEITDISDLIALGCRAIGTQSSSKYTVNGQSPPNDPVEMLGSEPGRSKITEAQGWTNDANNLDIIKLLSQNPSNIPWLKSPPCHDL